MRGDKKGQVSIDPEISLPKCENASYFLLAEMLLSKNDDDIVKSMFVSNVQTVQMAYAICSTMKRLARSSSALGRFS